jgi:hypothetical protein
MWPPRRWAEPLPWRNSTLLKGDAVEAVAGLKEEIAESLVVFVSVLWPMNNGCGLNC